MTRLKGSRKLTPELIDDFCALLCKGLTVKASAESLKLGRSTVYHWLSLGKRKRKTLYGEFARKVLEAKQNYEDVIIQTVRSGVDGRLTQKKISEQLDITPRTFCNWLAKGEHDNNGFYGRLVKEMEAVEQERRQRLYMEYLQRAVGSPNRVIAKHASSELKRLTNLTD